MKKIILAMCIGTLTATSLIAQTIDQTAAKTQKEKKSLNPEERAKKDAERAEKKLGLTADQKKQWESAALLRVQANAPLQQKLKGSTTPEERKEIHGQMKKNKEVFNASVLPILTAEQKLKYEQLQKEREAKAHKMKQRRRNVEGKEMANPN